MSRLSPPPVLSQPTNTNLAVRGRRSPGSAEGDVVVGKATEDDGLKKRCRGRPRKDNKDEKSAADWQRRRTQIRLAQRAYRQRKDTAITSLEKRVKELEKANHDISKDVDAFFGILVSERLLVGPPQTLQRLSSIANNITTTAENARASNGDISLSHDDDDGPGDGNEVNDSRSSPRLLRVNTLSSAPPISPSVPFPMQDILPQEASFQETNYTTTCQASVATAVASMAPASYSSPLIYVPPAVNYEAVTGTAPQNAHFPFYSSIEPSSYADFEENMARASSPYQTPPVPFSYAAVEQTFGRRLQRFTCESALRLITSPNPPPDQFAAIFGFCLFFETREEIIRRLKVTLNRTQYEDLCLWKFPFSHLGGAGTFFQDQSSMESSNSASGGSSNGGILIGNQGTQSFGKPQHRTPMSMGPWGPAVQETRDERIDYGSDGRMQMMLAGFEGDFFDPDEVETYLRQLGIFIPPQAEFIDAEIDVHELEEYEEAHGVDHGSVLQPQQAFYSRGGSANATYQSSALNTTGSNSVFNSSSASGTAKSLSTSSNIFMAEVAGMHHSRRAFSGPAPASGYADKFGGTVPSPYVLSPSASNSNGVAPQPIQRPNKVKVTVDVGVLMRQLMEKSICLGRCPGVRRKDIKTAIKIAAGLVLGSG
ncbi:hypothetical protein E4U21_001015 [Claviceps maximensis]|nr:hypothetical protein E4U21_001015 [Claviceps maximensis]